MPIFEYECASCGEITERDCKMAVRPTRIKCSACSSMRTHQIISSTSFQLTGTGWYKDGYGGNVKKRGSR